MRKINVILICLLLLSGCTLNKEEKREEQKSNSNTLEKLKQENIYNVEYKEEVKKLDHGISAKRNRVSISSKKKDGSKNISKYLNKVIDDSYSEFEKVVKDEYNKDSNYIFDYKYSLVSENNKYITFKLHYIWQEGGPYPVEADSYYMFNINTGNIVEFNELFSSDIKSKVYDYILSYLKTVYKENDMEYNESDYDLETTIFAPGYYVLNNGKLSFSLPRGSFTIAALGSINIDIDSSIYSSHIK